MSKQREALKIALQALEEIAAANPDDWEFDKSVEAKRLISEALAEPEQKPEPEPEPEPVEILEFPERVTLADLEYAQATPKEWSDEYRNIWQSLQVSEANNMMLRKYAHKLREALAEPEKANQCGETCERAKLCAVCANGLVESEPWTPDDMAYRPGGLPMDAEQAPVAWMCPHDPERETAFSWRSGMCESSGCGHQRIPLYTAPPARKPLTDEEINCLLVKHGKGDDGFISFARAIERVHGIGD